MPAAYAEDTMNLEIDYLLDTVAASGCIFIRNGSEHDAVSARGHLNLKRRRGKRYFSSADEFIDRLASSSSWSGKPYHIRCGEEEQLAKEWFTAVLEDYRSTQARLEEVPTKSPLGTN
jgi:hypothetical protein